MKILSYIFENIRSENLFVGTQRMIAEETSTSTQTVTITMKALMDADIIKRQHSGAYFVNPDVIFKGGTSRMDITFQYHAANKKEMIRNNKKSCAKH